MHKGIDVEQSTQFTVELYNYIFVSRVPCTHTKIYASNYQYCYCFVRVWYVITFKISRFKSLGSVSLRLIRIPVSEIPAPDLTSFDFHPQ